MIKTSDILVMLEKVPESESLRWKSDSSVRPASGAKKSKIGYTWTCPSSQFDTISLQRAENNFDALDPEKPVSFEKAIICSGKKNKL